MELVQQGFDAAAAIAYGNLINIVYSVYDDPKNQGNPSPPIPPLPGDFDFIAYVQMKDFFIASTSYQFYGLIAQSSGDPSRFVMAIRGTHGLIEWFDDLASVVPGPWEGPGNVGYGFNRIYSTMQVVKPGTDGASTALLADGRPAESFAEQVAKTVHEARNSRAPTAVAPSAPINVEVCGHSLGSALATLYVAQNAAPKGDAPGSGYDIVTPLLYTFASPRVGDPTFAAAFDALPITSWRIVNELDLVPKVPIIGFEHVATPQYYNSGWSTKWSIECWHNLDTYLHLINASSPLSPSCVPSSSAVDRMASLSRPLLARESVRISEPEPAVAVQATPMRADGSVGATVTVTVSVTGFDRG